MNYSSVIKLLSVFLSWCIVFSGPIAMADGRSPLFQLAEAIVKGREVVPSTRVSGQAPVNLDPESEGFFKQLVENVEARNGWYAITQSALNVARTGEVSFLVNDRDKALLNASPTKLEKFLKLSEQPESTITEVVDSQGRVLAKIPKNDSETCRFDQAVVTGRFGNQTQISVTYSVQVPESLAVEAPNRRDSVHNPVLTATQLIVESREDRVIFRYPGSKRDHQIKLNKGESLVSVSTGKTGFNGDDSFVIFVVRNSETPDILTVNFVTVPELTSMMANSFIPVYHLLNIRVEEGEDIGVRFAKQQSTTLPLPRKFDRQLLKLAPGENSPAYVVSPAQMQAQLKNAFDKEMVRGVNDQLKDIELPKGYKKYLTKDEAIESGSLFLTDSEGRAVGYIPRRLLYAAHEVQRPNLDMAIALSNPEKLNQLLALLAGSEKSLSAERQRLDELENSVKQEIDNISQALAKKSLSAKKRSTFESDRSRLKKTLESVAVERQALERHAIQMKDTHKLIAEMAKDAPSLETFLGSDIFSALAQVDAGAHSAASVHISADGKDRRQVATFTGEMHEASTSKFRQSVRELNETSDALKTKMSVIKHRMTFAAKALKNKLYESAGSMRKLSSTLARHVGWTTLFGVPLATFDQYYAGGQILAGLQQAAVSRIPDVVVDNIYTPLLAKSVLAQQIVFPTLLYGTAAFLAQLTALPTLTWLSFNANKFFATFLMQNPLKLLCSLVKKDGIHRILEEFNVFVSPIKQEETGSAELKLVTDEEINDRYTGIRDRKLTAQILAAKIVASRTGVEFARLLLDSDLGMTDLPPEQMAEVTLALTPILDSILEDYPHDQWDSFVNSMEDGGDEAKAFEDRMQHLEERAFDILESEKRDPAIAGVFGKVKRARVGQFWNKVVSIFFRDSETKMLRTVVPSENVVRMSHMSMIWDNVLHIVCVSMFGAMADFDKVREELDKHGIAWDSEKLFDQSRRSEFPESVQAELNSLHAQSNGRMWSADAANGELATNWLMHLAAGMGYMTLYLEQISAKNAGHKKPAFSGLDIELLKKLSEEKTTTKFWRSLGRYLQLFLNFRRTGFASSMLKLDVARKSFQFVPVIALSVLARMAVGGQDADDALKGSVFFQGLRPLGYAFFWQLFQNALNIQLKEVKGDASLFLSNLQELVLVWNEKPSDDGILAAVEKIKQVYLDNNKEMPIQRLYDESMEDYSARVYEYAVKHPAVPFAMNKGIDFITMVGITFTTSYYAAYIFTQGYKNLESVGWFDFNAKDWNVTLGNVPVGDGPLAANAKTMALLLVLHHMGAVTNVKVDALLEKIPRGLRDKLSGFTMTRDEIARRHEVAKTQLANTPVSRAGRGLKSAVKTVWQSCQTSFNTRFGIQD